MPIPILYHYPMSCSTACRIAAAERGVDLRIEPVDVFTKRIEAGGSLFDVSPLGQVPTMILPDGTLLTENTAILYWIDTQGREHDYTLLRWLSFCATELHAGLIRPLMTRATDETTHSAIRRRADSVFHHADEHVQTQPYLCGQEPGAADAYFFWCLTLLTYRNVPFQAWEHIQDLYRRLGSRPDYSGIMLEDQSQVLRLRETAGSQRLVRNPVLDTQPTE